MADVTTEATRTDELTGLRVTPEGVARVTPGHDRSRARRGAARAQGFYSVDPLADAMPFTSPYAYAFGDPVNYVDPTGMAPEEHAWGTRYTGADAQALFKQLQSAAGPTTTIVRAEADGTYTVTGGVDDGSTDIVDEDGNLVGRSVTPYSFMDDEGGFVLGAPIDPLSMDGQGFLDREITFGNPSLTRYMANARGGQPLDYKTVGIGARGALTPDQYRYRGSMLRGGAIASARDVGNIGAGMVAGRAGLSWRAARMGFDGLQTWQDLGWGSLRTGPSVEGRTSVTAQGYGYRLGRSLGATDGR